MKILSRIWDEITSFCADIVSSWDRENNGQQPLNDAYRDMWGDYEN